MASGSTTSTNRKLRIIGNKFDATRTAPSLAANSSANAPFPNGNGHERIWMTSKGPVREWFDPDKSKYPLLIAQPHPYRDVSRLQLEYDCIPSWLYYAKAKLASNAVAVVLTHPPDVQKISTRLLGVLGFEEPYHVLAAREDLGTQVDHSEVLLVARRSKGIEDVSFLRKYGVLSNPVRAAKLIVPTANRALVLFPPEDYHRHKDWDHSGLGTFSVSGRSGWEPWED
jgi:hypothetical protein